MPEIDGHCDPAFAAVRAAFANNFEEHDELGAAICIHVGGHTVVDLWGGHRDRARTRRFRQDTLVNAWSIGKGILSILALHLVERRLLDLDEPVARLWPEFGEHGKGDLGLRTLLCHQAGLPSVRRRLPADAWQDWTLLCSELAAMEPWWEPGTAHGYHTNTFGFLVGELVRRATGLDVGEALRHFLARPIDADFFWGLPEKYDERVSEIDVTDVQLTEPEQWAKAFPPTGDDERDRMIWHCYFNPPGLSGTGTVNTPEWLRAQIPSTNGQATARAVAALYDALLRGTPDGTRLLGPGLLSEATEIHADGEDVVLRRPSRFGLGFQLSYPERRLGPNDEAFGHYGYGGSLGLADPAADVALGFLTNRPGDRWKTPRTRALVDALYLSLGA